MKIIHRTGQEDLIPEDRDAIYVTFGRGNSDQRLEVFLEYVTPDQETPLGWFSVADLQDLVNTATTHYQNGTLPR